MTRWLCDGQVSTGTGLITTTPQGPIEAVPIDDRTFLVDVTNLDTPTVTFGGFDDNVRPDVPYEML